MMGLHQNYPVTWGVERMEGLTLDLGLDGMFSPLPAELNPVVTRDSDPPSSWRGFFGHSQTQQDITADVNLDDDDGDDPCALLDSSNCVGRPERKPDMFELSLSYPPPLPRQQHLGIMKVEREDVVPSLTAAMPALPEADLTSQSEGSFHCWRNTTLELPPKVLHLYGTVGDGNSEEEFPNDDPMDDFPEMKPERCASSSVLPPVTMVQQHPETIILDDTMDDFPGIKPGRCASSGVRPAARHLRQTYPETIILDDAMDDFPEIKPDRCASSSILSAAAQKRPMHPDTIILDDDTDDDECVFDEQDESVLLSWCRSDSIGSQKRVVAVSQAMPLRQIKQHVRSSKNDEDYNACATPSSAVPETTTRHQEFGAKELETGGRNHQVGEQAQQPNLPNPTNPTKPKRVRGYGDHDWLPSDLLDAAHSESRNEAKRARRNWNGEQQNDVPGVAPMDAPVLSNATAQCTEPGVQVQIQNPLIDVNQAIQEMPQDTAEAFKELIRLVGPYEDLASRAEDEMKNRRPLSDVRHIEPPQTSPTVSQQSSRAVDEMESSMRSVAIDFIRDTSDNPAGTAAPATVNQASRIVDEMESWRPLASDVQDDDPTPSQRSATTSDFEQGYSPPVSTSGFWQNDSPPLATTVDQPIFPQGGTSCLPSESATRSENSPHRTAVYEHQNAGKITINADVVLYEPKQEPVESRRENNMSGSVINVKQEPQLVYEPIPDHAFIRPVEESAGVGPCYSNRELILAALDTFEKVRQQILRDPSYGQSVVDVQQTTTTEGSKSNNRRLRADLKAASMMRKRGFWLNAAVRPIGDVPGVTVGDCFSYRIEMAVIGLHRAVQAGIAVVPVEYSPYGVKVASSVVMGVGDPYQDDKDMGDTVVYSGQGGLCNRTKESQDQQLTRGNLALSNSYNLKLPVRLIRGHKEQNSKTGILYSYDGLYQIVDMNYVTGVNGKKVFKFTMHRMPGQPPLSSGYPAPLGSQPPAREPAQNVVHWTEVSDTKPLYLEKRPVAEFL